MSCRATDLNPTLLIATKVFCFKVLFKLIIESLKNNSTSIRKTKEEFKLEKG